MKLANKVASLCQKNEFIALKGGVGSGKTTFAKYFVQFFCSKETRVPSPTYNFVFTYKNNFNTIWHFDLYRLKTSSEVWELGIEDALEKGILLVEWPELIKNHFPRDRLEIQLKILAENTNVRSVTLNSFGKWKNRKIGYGN
ncbi:MAG: tRNA (adenosine(37)-N6)-threonylcarbamoyltransferase complex ATPase subunit type 1 TsaE [Rhodospirillaceae bacterium]|mgnify:FL=1|nr:tRNA (adenosine(37)-N6)-threonylcarbamoyltransferase complex ATPase subunit type 1 TsaE [Rhodospirillaceae bacterium]|tara:strand:+ start:2678 stop:3103 length:426 start_codon:yes stop_codon:yes gene_type:complete